MPTLLLPARIPSPSPIDDITRRDLLRGAGVLLVAAACGDRAVPEGAARPDTSVGPRHIEHLFGTTTLTGVPDRVVTLDIAHLGHLLPLGVLPVASVEFGGKIIPPAYEAAARQLPDTDRITSVGAFGEPNLEAVAAARPDVVLMFGLPGSNEDLYQRLSQVAPTVATSLGHSDWKADLRLIAEVLDRAGRGQELLADYDQRVTELRSRHGRALAEPEFSILNSGADRFFVYTDGTWITQVTSEIGLRISAAQQEQLDGIGEVSLERVSLIDTDVILNMVQDPATLDEPQLVGKLRAERNPLWARLRAVEAGQVYDVDATLWTGGRSLLGAHLVLDDLARILPGVKKLPPA